jgi:hypothetical protein
MSFDNLKFQNTSLASSVNKTSMSFSCKKIEKSLKNTTKLESNKNSSPTSPMENKPKK